MKTNKSNGQLTAQINLGDHKKSGFDLSNNVLGTGKIGRIIPTRALHVMPGDTIKAESKVAVQFEPLAVPILANMEVKQEHFYVPYNVVWKDWDKFISGGEKLDYHGVVPNVQMKRMFSIVAERFGFPLLETTIVQSGTGDDLKIGWTMDLVQRGVFELWQKELDTLANAFHIKDILQPQYEIIKMIQDIYENMDNYVSKVDFIVVQGHQDVGYRDYYIDAYLDNFGMRGNKYIEEIMPLIKEEQGTRPVVLPTDRGFALLHYLYEMIKPFVGLGSNIDYINMGRLTLSEFIANSVHVFSEHYDTSQDPNLSFAELGATRYLSFAPLSVLNLRANYNVWYNNYRDILLEKDAAEPVDTSMVTDDELFVLLVPRQRCWEKDAFTTALDNPGTGSVGVPVGIAGNDSGSVYQYFTQMGTPEGSDIDSNDVYQVKIGDKVWQLPTAYLSGINEKDLGESDTVSGFSLYALDAAQRAQKWLQKALFYGNRISDFYYMRFGVRFLDARLRLPELLTSSSELVKLDVVMNNTNITTEAGGEVFRSIAGDRAAYASAYDNGNSFDRFCEEHGVIMSYLTIMPQVTYAYGINRDYSRLDQFDYAFAEFATLGMDAVYDTEITATSLNDNSIDGYAAVFGYQGRYYDYKAKHSEEHGELLDSQDMYTFARKFNMFDKNGRPKLNYEFVHCFPSLDMFVVDSPLADYFRYDIRHSTAAERELPSQSIYI